MPPRLRSSRGVRPFAPAGRRCCRRAFYEFAIGQANGRPLVAEVNLRPRNDVSLAFHAAFGFEQVGTQRVEGGAKEVAMLCRDPNATGLPAQ